MFLSSHSIENEIIDNSTIYIINQLPYCRKWTRQMWNFGLQRSASTPRLIDCSISNNLPVEIFIFQSQYVNNEVNFYDQIRSNSSLQNLNRLVMMKIFIEINFPNKII